MKTRTHGARAGRLYDLLRRSVRAKRDRAPSLRERHLRLAESGDTEKPERAHDSVLLQVACVGRISG